MRPAATTLVTVVVIVLLGAVWWWLLPSAGLIAAPELWPTIGTGTVMAFGGAQLLGAVVLAVLADVFVLDRRVGRAEGLGMGVVGAAALLGASPLSTLLIGAAGAAATLVRTGGARRVQLPVRMVQSVALPVLFAVIAQLGGPRVGGPDGLHASLLLTLTVLFCVGAPVVEALETRLGPAERRVDVLDQLRTDVQTRAVVAAVAALTALTYPALGWPALPLVVVPLQSVRAGFRLRNEGAEAVDQALVAMSRVPEWLGVVEHAHAERCVDAVRVAGAMAGLSSPVRRSLVEAAQAHELGCLDRAAVEAQLPVPDATALVLEEAGVRAEVVEIVRGPSEADRERAVAAVLLTQVCAALRDAPRADPVEVGRTVGRRHQAAAV